MFRSAFIDIFKQTWPMILICSVILILMRITYFIKNKKKCIFYKEIMMLLFVIYIMCLFYVVTFQDVSWSTSNFVPFKEMFRYPFGSHLFFKNVLGNVIMFAPYGFFLGYFLKLEKGTSVFVLSFLTSITIETVQSAIGRVFDIDDIFLNIIGGLFGYYIYILILKIRNRIPSCLKKQAIYNIIITLLLLGFILYIGNINIWVKI